MSPRRTPAETTAPAKPTRARPSRSRSVMSNLPSIVPCEHPPPRAAPRPPGRGPVGLTTLEIGPAYLALPGAYYSAVPCRGAVSGSGCDSGPLRIARRKYREDGTRQGQDAVNSSSWCLLTTNGRQAHHPRTLGWSPDRLPCPHSGTNTGGSVNEDTSQTSRCEGHLNGGQSDTQRDTLSLGSVIRRRNIATKCCITGPGDHGPSEMKEASGRRTP